MFSDVLSEIVNTVELSCLNNGKELMGELNKRSDLPDVIFLDVNMPIMDGIATLERIKNNPRFGHIPVIMLSTSCQQHAVERAFQLGARFFIQKPDSFGKLKTLLESLFGMELKITSDRNDFLLSS